MSWFKYGTRTSRDFITALTSTTGRSCLSRSNQRLVSVDSVPQRPSITRVFATKANSSMPQKAPYGTWKSPITADILTQKSIDISDVLIDSAIGKEDVIYHTENRPYEEGRVVPVLSQKGIDVFPLGWSARTGVYEYGGSCTAVHDGIFYFSDAKSRRLHRSASPEAEPVPVSPDNSNFRYAGIVVHPTQPHLVVSLFEDHTKPAPSEVVNKLVCVNTKTLEVTTLAEGADFYSFPAISPDGKRLAFVQWHHPNMPWEASELYTVDIVAREGGIDLDGKITHVAGRGEESVHQPLWISKDELVFITDKSDFSNPWLFDATTGSTTPILETPLASDFGEPDWYLGDWRIAALTPNILVVAPIVNARAQLSLLHVRSGQLTPIESPYVDISRIKRVSETQVVFIGVQDAEAAALVLMTINGEQSGGTNVGATFTVLKATSSLSSLFPKTLFSPDVPLSLPNPDDAHPLHLMLASPQNPEYDPEGKGDGEKPPCIVLAHGGPTGRSSPGLAWLTQYFTSRGWAFCSVNFGGSSGYGRAYRERLRGQWGVVEVEDCVSAVRLLGERGLIDPKRVAIRGRSSGGYTVLQALVNTPDVWAAGTSLYGISDLKALAEETHKFESQYGFKLIGGTMEEVPQIYRDRSPVHFAEKITAPLLILQGSADRVVPPNQSEMIVNKIKQRVASSGGDVDSKVKYVVFDGEGHGWRKGENQKRALEEELAWYEKAFGLGDHSET